METADRGTNPRLRKSLSLAISAGLHSWILAWVILGEPSPPSAPKSIYDQEIRPYEKKIVWYSLQEKLPEIAPAAAQTDPRPLRARVNAPQSIVAGEKDLPESTPLIHSPQPQAPEPKRMPLPNVVAIAPPPQVTRPFVEPPQSTPKIAPPNLPEPPRVTGTVQPRELALSGAGPKPEPRAFTPPPSARLQRQAPILLPEAPAAASLVEPNALPFANAGAKPRPRDFVAPHPARAGTSDAPALSPAPETSRTSPAASGNALERLPRPFLAPPSRPNGAPGAPPVPSDAPLTSGTPSQATLAIVGLNPARGTDVPPPPPSRAAGFSSGPELHPDGGTSSKTMPLLNVPGLTVSDGSRDARPAVLAPFSPTSRENLMAAARTVAPSSLRTPPEPDSVGRRVSQAPDERFSGREVYSIAIQMPNITSFSGSWLVWFAAREALPIGPGAPLPLVKAPIPMRKVDPKYIAAAVAERIEGTVRLFGVIRKDGHVDSISLLRHLDDRLDQSASEALAKWEFTPATRNGSPIEIDAVFEIPFHLAPKPTK